MTTCRARLGEGSLVGPTLEQSENLLANQQAPGKTGAQHHESIELPASIIGDTICRAKG